jgi:hypothetical protein
LKKSAFTSSGLEHLAFDLDEITNNKQGVLSTAPQNPLGHYTIKLKREK